MNRRELAAGLLAFPWRALAANPGVRVGCQTRAYGSPIRDHQKLLKVLEELAQLDYTGFETNFASLEASFDNPAPMRAEIEKRRVELVGLHLGAKWYDPATSTAELDRVKRVAKAVKDFGGHFIIASGNRFDGVPGAEGLRRKCAKLNEAGRICRDAGIQFSYHNHWWEFDHEGAEFKAILGDTDASTVGIWLDARHSARNGWDPGPLVARHGRRIVGLHLSDVSADGKDVEMGAGVLDFSGLGKALSDTRWAGWIVVEIELPGIEPRHFLKGARDYIRKHLKA